MSTVAVRRMLEDYLDVDLNFYALVKCNGVRVYFCLARHSFFLVDELLEKQKDSFFLAHIGRVLVDASQPDLFMLDMIERDNLVFETTIRAKVLQELQVYWQSDTILRIKKVMRFPVETGQVKGSEAKGKSLREEIRKPPPGKKSFSLAGWFFFGPAAMSPDVPASKAAARARKGKAINFDEMTYEFAGSARKIIFRAFHELRVNVLGRSDRSSLRLAAERLLASAVEGNEFVLLDSKPHRKRQNLSGDPASWRCWQVWIRHADRDLGIVMARRKYIPPFAETYQDLAWISVGPKGIPVAQRVDPKEELRGLADSVSPEMENFIFDHLVTKTKLKNLLLDEEAYLWYNVQLREKPAYAPLTAKFAQWVALVLKADGSVAFKEAEEMFPEAGCKAEELEVMEGVLPDPFPIVERELPEYVSGEVGKPCDERWKRKVGVGFWEREKEKQQIALYVAHYIDGTANPDLSLKELVDYRMSKGCSAEAAQVLDGILDYCLFLRLSDGTYERSTLKEKIVNPALFGDDAELTTMNETVMAKLLELGYCEFLLRSKKHDILGDDGDTSIMRADPYVRLLVSLLKRKSGYGLLSMVCGRIALLSLDPDAREELAAAGAARLLVQLLHSSDALLLISCAKALTNMAAGTNAAKSAIVDAGAIELAIPHISSRNQPLATSFALMLRNCMDTDEHRLQIAEDGGVRALVRLLAMDDLLTVDRASSEEQEELLAASAGALWKVSATRSISIQIGEEGGVSLLVALLESGGVLGGVPLQVPEEKEEEGDGGEGEGGEGEGGGEEKDGGEKEPVKGKWSEVVLEKVCGALMALVAGNDDLLDEAGRRGAVRHLVQILRTTRKPSLAINAVAAIWALSALESNLEIMREEDVESWLKRAMRTKEKKIEAYAERVLARL